DDRLTVARARKTERFLSQPFLVAEVFTCSPGKYLRLPRSTLFPYTTLFRSQRLQDEYDQLRVLSPEEATSDSPQKVRQFTDAKRSEEHTSELQSRENLVCRLLLEKKTSQEHEKLSVYYHNLLS